MPPDRSAKSARPPDAAAKRRLVPNVAPSGTGMETLRTRPPISVGIVPAERPPRGSGAPALGALLVEQRHGVQHARTGPTTTCSSRVARRGGAPRQGLRRAAAGGGEEVLHLGPARERGDARDAAPARCTRAPARARTARGGPRTRGWPSGAPRGRRSAARVRRAPADAEHGADLGADLAHRELVGIVVGGGGRARGVEHAPAGRGARSRSRRRRARRARARRPRRCRGRRGGAPPRRRGRGGPARRPGRRGSATAKGPSPSSMTKRSVRSASSSMGLCTRT